MPHGTTAELPFAEESTLIMRDHAIISPRLWTGETGRYLRECGGDAQRLAFYLLTCPNSNMVGLYYLPLPTLCYEIGEPFNDPSTGVNCAREVFQKLTAGEFCRYDEDTSTVWVENMAKWQIGDTLSAGDKRRKAIMRLVDQHKDSPFHGMFFAKYSGPYHLDAITSSKRRGIEDSDSTSGCPIPRGIEGASKGHANLGKVGLSSSHAPSHAPSKGHAKVDGDGLMPHGMPLRSQEQDQDQDQDQEQEQEAHTGVTSDATERLAMNEIQFKAFWDQYPKRNGKRLGKAKSRSIWDRLTTDERNDVLTATGHYAASKTARDGFAKDPENFLDGEFWAEWLDGPGEVPAAPDATADDASAASKRAPPSEAEERESIRMKLIRQQGIRDDAELNRLVECEMTLRRIKQNHTADARLTGEQESDKQAPA